jgi:hypothetical protein
MTGTYRIPKNDDMDANTAVTIILTLSIFIPSYARSSLMYRTLTYAALNVTDDVLGFASENTTLCDESMYSL